MPQDMLDWKADLQKLQTYETSPLSLNAAVQKSSKLVSYGIRLKFVPLKVRCEDVDRIRSLFGFWFLDNTVY